MTSLVEELSKLTNPEPLLPDTEEFGDYAWAKPTDGQSSENVVVGAGWSHKQTDLEEDVRYSGTRISRKQLQEQYELAEFKRSLIDDNKALSGSEGEEKSNEADNDDSEDDDEEGMDDEDEDKDPDDKLGDEQSDAGDDVESDSADIAMNGRNYDNILSTDEDDGDRSNTSTLKRRKQKHTKAIMADDGEDSNGGSNDSDDEESEESNDDSDEDNDDVDSDKHLEGNTRGGALEEVKKGKCTILQLGLWENLLKIRIKLQKCLSLVNRLPHPNVWSQFEKDVGDPFHAAAVNTRKDFKNLLDGLVEFQTQLLASNKQTASLVNDSSAPFGRHKDDDDDNEEIPSDTDMETEKVTTSVPQKDKITQPLKRKMTNYPEFLAKRHKSLEKYRNETIQKWSERVSSKGFRAFDQSVVKQIQQILSDKPRLIARTQVKRSSYQILGEKEVESEKTQPIVDDVPVTDVPPPRSLPAVDTDSEIFDDDDFYHQLLRELIQRKTVGVDDPVALSRQWLEIQKLRKNKKAVNTKASKGRRIRYDVHRKLVNFMAPVLDSHQWRNEQRCSASQNAACEQHLLSSSNVFDVCSRPLRQASKIRLGSARYVFS